MRVKNAIEFSFTPRQQQLKERRWDYDLVSLAADARVTGDGNLVGLQVPRTCEAASWEPNEVYEELHETSVVSEEGQEERDFQPTLEACRAACNSGNGVVVPYEAPVRLAMHTNSPLMVP